MEKSEFWCYGKNEVIKICPICNKPIYSGAIMVERWHAECIEKSPVIMQRWIPVTERLPEEKINPITSDFYVYPVTMKFDYFYDIRYYTFGLGHWWHGSAIMDEYVTAWMPLLEPYKAESEE